jgi:hypothetical protein
MNEGSVALFGIEAGLLKGLDTLRWTLECVQKFAEIRAISTVVQSTSRREVPCLRVVVKTSVEHGPEQLIAELKKIEIEYEEQLKGL